VKSSKMPSATKTPTPWPSYLPTTKSPIDAPSNEPSVMHSLVLSVDRSDKPSANIFEGIDLLDELKNLAKKGASFLMGLMQFYRPSKRKLARKGALFSMGLTQLDGQYHWRGSYRLSEGKIDCQYWQPRMVCSMCD